MVLQDGNLAHLNEDDEKDVFSNAPPTKVVTVRQHFTSTDHDEMLILAQEQFNQLRKKNRERVSSVRYGRSVTKRRVTYSKEELKITQLLSSLLYLSLMMHRVDDMKKILESSDSTLYNEWYPLLDTMHSPMFHLYERKLQNDRVKKIYNRKRKYRGLYEEAKASLATMEATSRELSQSLSQMSEQNLKSQTLLEKKSEVQVMLSAAAKEVEHLQVQLQRQESTTDLTKSECRDLEMMLKELEVEKAELTQKVMEYEKVSCRTTQELLEMNTDLEKKNMDLNSVRQSLVSKGKEVESLQEQLRMESLMHERILQERDKQFHFLRASEESLQSSLNMLELKMTELKARVADEKAELQQSNSDAKQETAIITVKLVSSQEAFDRVQNELSMKNMALEKAVEATRYGQNNVTKLREMIAEKDREIHKLNEKSRLDEIKLLKVENKSECLAEVHNGKSSKLEGIISHLEEKLKDLGTKNKMLEDKISNILASKVDLQEETKSQQTTIAVMKKDNEHCENKTKDLENKLTEQVSKFKEYEESTNEMLNGLSAKSIACEVEKQRLTAMLETMQNSIKKNEESANKSKESVEAKTNETEKELHDIKLKLAQARAENSVLISSSSSTSQALANAQARVVSNEKENLLLRRSIEKLKKDNTQFSVEIDLMREQCMIGSKANQMVDEMKANHLGRQLEVSSNSLSSKSMPPNEMLLSSEAKKSGPVGGYEVVTMAAADFVDEPASSNSMTSSAEHECAKTMVENVMSAAVVNASR